MYVCSTYVRTHAHMHTRTHNKNALTRTMFRCHRQRLKNNALSSVGLNQHVYNIHVCLFFCLVVAVILYSNLIVCILPNSCMRVSPQTSVSTSKRDTCPRQRFLHATASSLRQAVAPWRVATCCGALWRVVARCGALWRVVTSVIEIPPDDISMPVPNVLAMVRFMLISKDLLEHATQIK